MHLSCYLIDWIIVVFCVIQVAALQKNIASQTVGAPAFLLHLNALSDDLEARSPRREQAGRCRGESGDARRIVSEVEIETADPAMGDAAVGVVKSKVTACVLSSRHCHGW
jgi:hypothetical protein